MNTELKSQRPIVNSQHPVWARVLLSVGVLLLSACRQTFPASPIVDIDGLTNAGMYVYLVPETTLAERDWGIEVLPFQFDCDLYDVWQPLHVFYRDNTETLLLSMDISDNSPFVEDAPYINILPDGHFEMEIISTQSNQAVQVQYWQHENPHYLQAHFTDVNGLDVVFQTPALSLVEFQTVLQRLEYVGEANDPVIPWRDSCR